MTHENKQTNKKLVRSTFHSDFRCSSRPNHHSNWIQAASASEKRLKYSHSEGYRTPLPEAWGTVGQVGKSIAWRSEVGGAVCVGAVSP